MSHSTLQDFLTHFPDAKRRSGQWLARCPSHDDSTASLTIREGTDAHILVHCHAGCEIEAILTAVGLEVSELFLDEQAPSPKRRTMDIVATYDYLELQTRTLLYQVCRLNPKDFRPRRPNGNGGWLWNLSGVERVLYRLPDLVGHAAVVVAEGEKDCNAAWTVGIPATTNVGGAGKWRPEETQQLVDVGVKRVAIVPDDDEPGRQHALQVAYSTAMAGLQVRIVPLPDVPPKGDLSDYLARHSKEDFVQLIRRTSLWTPERVPDTPPDPIPEFQRLSDGRYRFTVMGGAIRFELTQVRWSHNELIALLTVDCRLDGARTTDGQTLHMAEFNLSSAAARVTRAKILAVAARTQSAVDWTQLVEVLCQRVLRMETTGVPAVVLADVVPTRGEQEHNIYGLVLPKRSTAMIVGDGGAGKSEIALFIGGTLVERGEQILVCDWESVDSDWHDRARCLFGSIPRGLLYLGCTAPMIQEVDRVRREIANRGITYVIVDSVIEACHDEPEGAATAAAYWRASRSLGVGSTHVTHVPKSAVRGSERPFGSQFWWNGARSIWFLESQASPDRLTIACHHRKCNTGPLRPAVGFAVTFATGRTTVEPCDLNGVPELAEGLPVWQRIQDALQNGPLTLADVADQLGVKVPVIELAAKHRPTFFAKILGTDGIARLALAERMRL